MKTIFSFVIEDKKPEEPNLDLENEYSGNIKKQIPYVFKPIASINPKNNNCKKNMSPTCDCPRVLQVDDNGLNIYA